MIIPLLIGALFAQDCRFMLLTPAQPPLKVDEGESATESQTFQTAVFALSPNQTPYFYDAAFRIRRIDSSGRITTIAGNGTRGITLSDGPADQPLPTITQLLFSRSGVLHFVTLGRVFKIESNKLEVVAGSGLPGFNGETGSASRINLGSITHAAFSASGNLLLLDGFNRLRQLFPDGSIRTIAGSTRIASASGLTGDEGPATQAAISNARQIIPFPNGNIWLRDLSGRHIRLITPDGIIDTVNTNFDASINILLLADGSPAAATANRVFPIRTDGNIETGSSPYPPFTGTPRAIAPNGDLYFEGSTRPDQRSPLVRLSNRTQTVLAGAPIAATVDGQAPPYGVFYARNNSLLYSANLGGKTGILEARPGQVPRFIVGGGNDIGDAEGKTATNLTLFGILTFTVDNDGRIIIADTNRRRILVVSADGKVSILKTADRQEVIFAPLGAFSTLQRIVADAAGNIYWNSAAYTPPGGVLTVDLSVFNRSTSTITTLTVPGLNALARLEDGSAIAIAGNGAAFRNASLLTPNTLSPFQRNWRLLPLTSVSTNYFIAAGRLFRGDAGNIEYFDTTPLTPDFVISGNNQLFVHFNDGGFYRIESPDACLWQPQPKINAVTNAASYDFANTVSSRVLLTIFGSGLGPAEGQGLILDGALRASGQPAPYPALLLGNFSGAIPQATLTGTTMPVIYSNDQQVSVVAPAITTGTTFQLYFSWQGLTLFHPVAQRLQSTTPGLFASYVQQDNRLILYATGLGPIEGTTGLGDFLPTTILLNTTNTVSATIDDIDVMVEFAGGAPGQIGGLYQINLKVPAGLTPGRHQVIVTVAGQRSAPLAVNFN